MAVTRRSHKKSRYGCFSCKSRRIKCDEHHPTCHNCSRKKLNCSYPDLQIIDTEEHISSPSTTTITTTTSNNNNLNEYAITSTINYELIDFSFNKLYWYISTHPVEREMWLQNIKKLFWEQTGLYHILMATSAIFKYYEDTKQNEKYYPIGRYHYSKCLEDFPQSLNSKGSGDVSLASMFTSGLVTLYLAASTDYKICQPTFFRIGKGTSAVYSVSKDNLTNTLVPEIQERYYIKQYDTFTGFGFPEFLSGLLKLQFFETIVDVGEMVLLEDDCDFMEVTPVVDNELKYKQVYIKVLNLLYNQFTHTNNGTAASDRDYFPVITRWSVSVPEEFIYLLSKNDPRSLILISFLLRLIVSLESTWFKYAAYEEIKYIESILPESWGVWLGNHYS